MVRVTLYPGAGAIGGSRLRNSCPATSTWTTRLPFSRRGFPPAKAPRPHIPPYRGWDETTLAVLAAPAEAGMGPRNPIRVGCERPSWIVPDRVDLDADAGPIHRFLLDHARQLLADIAFDLHRAVWRRQITQFHQAARCPGPSTQAAKSLACSTVPLFTGMPAGNRSARKLRGRSVVCRHRHPGREAGVMVTL